jgi:hypothetical protein
VSVTVNCVQPIGFAYVTNSLDDTVSTYLVDQSGALLASGGPAAGTGTGPSGAAAIVSNINGTGFLYVTNKGSNDLSIYAIDPNTGVLTAQSANTAGLVTAPATIVHGYSSSTDLYVTGVDPNDSNVYSLTASSASLSNLEKPLVLPAVPAADTALVAAQSSMFTDSGTVTTYYYLTANPNTNSLYTYQVTSGLLAATVAPPTTVGSTPTSVAALTFTYPPGTPYAGNSYGAVYVADSGDGTIASYILSEDNNNLVTAAVCKPVPTIAKANAQLAQTTISPPGATALSFVLATDLTQLYAYAATSDACLATEVPGSRPFASGATPGPLATFNVNPTVNPTFVYAVDVSATTTHVFALGPNGLTPVLQQGNPATATTGKAPSAIVLSLRPAFSFYSVNRLGRKE